MKKIIGSLLIVLLVLPMLTLGILKASEGDAKEALAFFKNDKKAQARFIGFPGRALGVDDPKWERENIFLNDNLTELLGRRYEVTNFFSVPKSANSNPLKIVLFGDGYTWGNENTDRYSTVTALVQSKLDAMLGRNVADVVVRSISAAGTYNHYDYFKNNDVNKLNPDLVIYNFFDNDINPGFNESVVCRSMPYDKCGEIKMHAAELEPKYQDCLHGEGDSYSRNLGRFKMILPNRVKGMLEKHCKPLLDYAKKHEYNWIKALAEPFNSPFIELWKRTVKDLRASFGPTKAAVVKLIPMAPTFEDEKKMLKAYRDGGWEIVPMEKTRAYFVDSINNPTFHDDVRINPSVGYPSSFINNIFASDIANYIVKAIPKSRIDEAKKSVRSSEQNSDLVRFTMPVFDVKIERVKEDESRVIFNKKANPIYNQDPDQKLPAMPFQFTNCHNLGKANFIFVLNKDIKSGSVSLTNLPKNEDVEVGVYYYNKEFKRVYKGLGSYKEGSYINLPETSISNSIVLIFPKRSPGCEVDKVIEIPDFSINVKYKP